MKSTHILATIHKCSDESILYDKDRLDIILNRLISKSGLNILGKCFYKFKDAGVTAVFLLSESHVAIHTWPEKENSFTLDIHTCNVSKNNEECALNLFELITNYFSPAKIQSKVI